MIINSLIQKLFAVLASFILVTTLTINTTSAQLNNSYVLFYDDFSNNLNKWQIEWGNWRVANGILVSELSGINKPGRMKVGNDDWQNYRIEVDVNNLSGVDEGIGFRNNRIYQTNYELTLRHGTGPNNTPQVGLSKVFWQDSNSSFIVLVSYKPTSLVNNHLYHVTIEVLATNIKVWINQQLIINYNDDDFRTRSGSINLSTWTGSTGYEKVQFDNVKVTALAPNPFLDLPWDYEGKGLSFNEAALAINSFFDHQYPLLSRGLDLSEPANASTNIVNYLGQTTTEAYSKHDGYDWGIPAKAKLGDPVLAAASGSATYINTCSSCGNMIVIDHGNGYQTRYMHLLKNDLVTNTPNQPITVNGRQQIGKVGFSGNIWPNDERGAHIHFGVFQDKNGDNNFTDNEPDGITDPFGWQSDSTDPWKDYTFSYGGENRTGNKSYYLWKNNLASMISKVTPAGSSVNVGNYTLDFPKDSTNKDIIINAKSTPIVKLSDNLRSIGSTLKVYATDTLGNIITGLQNPFNLVLNFSSLDLSRIKINTLSLYSSPDGINWTKENTTFTTPTTALASINHLSYFALIGERKDTTPPITSTTLSGTKGQNGWFRSDVSLTLNAQDNIEGLGVYYTLYRIEDGEIQLYSSPLNFTDEGHYKVDFYSIDNDDNAESKQTVEFDIDKTLPQLSLDTSLHNFWPPNGKMINIQVLGNASDNNEVNTSFQVIDEYGLIQPQVSDFEQTIQLEAKRNGDDLDGRTYTVFVIATDKAGNTATASAQILVPHDQRN